MTAFTIGLLAGGIIGITLACCLERKRQKKKEEKNGSKELQV